MIPYELSVGNKPFYVFDTALRREVYLADNPNTKPKSVGLIALGLFRTDTYVDYAAIAKVDDDGNEDWFYRVHEQYEWIDWMNGDVHRDQERKKQLKATERSLGTFVLKHGWNPTAVLETAPAEIEMDSYIEHVMNIDEVDGNLVMPGKDDGN